MMFEQLTSRDLLSAAGSILEILGAIAMANAYLGAARHRHGAMVLVSALTRGKLAREATEARNQQWTGALMDHSAHEFLDTSSIV